MRSPPTLAPDAILKRRDDIASMLVMGYGMMTIAANVGVSVVTVRKDVEAIRSEWQAHRLETVDMIVSSELEKLTLVERRLWPGVMAADPEMVALWLRLSERRSKLLGLDSPTKVDIELSLRQQAVELGLDPDEAVGAARELVRRHLLG